MTTITNSNTSRQRKKRHTDSSGNGTIPTPSFDSILQNLASHALESMAALDSNNKPLGAKNNSQQGAADDEIECIEEVSSLMSKRRKERVSRNKKVVGGSEPLRQTRTSSENPSSFIIPPSDKPESRSRQSLMKNSRNIYGIRIAPTILRKQLMSRSPQHLDVNLVSTSISPHRRVYVPDATPVSCRISASMLHDRNVSPAVVLPTKQPNFITTNTNGTKPVSFCNNCTAEFPKIINSYVQ